MKKIKKLISVLTALFMALTLATPILAVDNDNGLDNTDLLIVAHNFMGDDEGLWPTTLEDLEIVPLYDLNNNVVAQYLKFSNAGYAVINNNKNNPAAIEFGYDDNTLIRDILNNNSNPHIIYNSPVSVYELNENDTKTINEETNGYHEHYTDLTARNNNLATMLSESKQTIENMPVPYSDHDFGFVHVSNLPTMDCNTKTILRADGIRNWGTTSLPGRKNCGAVAAFNLAYYYSKSSYTKLYKNHTDTYAAIYALVGDGPAISLTPKIKKYIENCGYVYNTKPASNYTSMRTALNANHVILLCLVDGIDEAHWILGVGYNHYDDGTMYVRVVDGWTETATYYYQPNSGSLFLTGYEIWPTK